MSGTKVGYARVATAGQEVAAQREGLAALGVAPKLGYVDHGLTGRNCDRPGLAQALVVTKLDRLARSLPDARDSRTNSPARASYSASAGPSTTRTSR